MIDGHILRLLDPSQSHSLQYHQTRGHASTATAPPVITSKDNKKKKKIPKSNVKNE